MSSIIAYKGFSKDWKCKDFQFEVGSTYTHDGEVKLCDSGFHACEAPLDCWTYYPPGESEFAQVELSGVSEEKESDSNRAGSTIRIAAQLNLAGLIKAQVEWVKSVSQPTTGWYAHSSTTGYRAHSSTTGDSAHSSTTGNYAHSSTTGYSAHSSTTGNRAHSSTTGNYAHSSTTGNYAHSSTTGDSAHSSTTGDSAIACNLGLDGKVKSTKGPLVQSYEDRNKVLRVAVAYVGESGIRADVWYRANVDGIFEEVAE